MMIFDHFIHGGDYNPDQWLDAPEILKQDLALMKKATVNCVTLNVFSWARLEPEEGFYQFDWLEKIIDQLYQEGIQVILATPSGAMPHWLTATYPEVMQVRDDGSRNLPGRRHNFCYTSPIMRKKIAALDERLSQRFGRHPAVILWHISNELGGNWGDGACHCESCQRAFRDWLKHKYNTLEQLNHTWWNAFWSHTYTDWGQIHSPTPHGECLVHALNLDWRRFVTDQMADFCGVEIAAVRKNSDIPVTTNFMGDFKNLNYQKLHHCLDIISWDNYPNWHTQKDEVPTAVRAAAWHSFMRSLKKQPFLMMESTPSRVNWRRVNPLKRPGMHMLSSMQAVAHGSNSVQYFQWRQGRGGYEKFHSAVVSHQGEEKTRTFHEVSEVGARLASLPEALLDACNQPKIAILFDWENWWALEDAAGPRLDMDYVKTVLEHYRAFWELGMDVDFVSMDEDLDAYTLVCAPIHYLYRSGYASRVRAYVQNGGRYVATCFSGLVDETDLCFTGSHPLTDVLGISVEEIDAPGEGFTNHVIYRGNAFSTGSLRERIHPAEGTKVLSVYEEDYCAGTPALTAHTFGKGKCWYIAAEMSVPFLKLFYQDILSEAHLSNPLGISLPYGVTTTVRRGVQDYVFVMNFKDSPRTLFEIGDWIDVETGEHYEDKFILDGFCCKILTRKHRCIAV